MQTTLFRLIRWFERLPRERAWALLLTTTALIGLIDYEIGYEASLSPLYLIPILLASWTMGLRIGLLFAFVESTTLTGSNLLAGGPSLALWITVWNVLVRGAVYAVVAYSVASLRAQLDDTERLALTDSLTGALNRKAFLQAVGKEMERAARTNRPFSIAYIDIDDFKKLNDAFGHRTGDELLIEFVSTCNGHLRSSDSIGRMGGDEFALLLPETDEATCEDTLRRLLSLCHAASWNPHAMTFSIGALTCLRAPPDIDAVILLADRLMYEVKRTGKGSIRHAAYRNGSASAPDAAEPLPERCS
jgi:diguanylate cyclase (GGDEF)-like protein